MKPEEEQRVLTGLHLCITDNLGTCQYDIGLIAAEALRALQVAILAMEQVVTGEKLVHSLHVGDFFGALDTVLSVENGQGVMSEPGVMSSLEDEIQGVIDIVIKARAIAAQPLEVSI